MVGGMWSIWGEKRKAYSVQVGKPEGRRQFRKTGLDRWIIIKWILKERIRWHSLNSSGSGYERVADSVVKK
jgi:hypothetical protein